jgi:hypothetical protein
MLDNHRTNGKAASLTFDAADDSIPHIDSADLGLVMLLVVFALLVFNLIRF